MASDLQKWISHKLTVAQAEASERGEALPDRLSAETRLFYVPSGLRLILDKDLKLAGIPKKDERGRTIDVHAIRHSFVSHLSANDVGPRTAQAAARHSDIRLTMNTDTDPKLLEVHKALDRLPALPIDHPEGDTEQPVADAETVDRCAGGEARKFAPKFAPDSVQSSPSVAIEGNTATAGLFDSGLIQEVLVAANLLPANEKDLLATPASRSNGVGAKGFEPSTSTSRT